MCSAATDAWPTFSTAITVDGKSILRPFPSWDATVTASVVTFDIDRKVTHPLSHSASQPVLLKAEKWPILNCTLSEMVYLHTLLFVASVT